MIKKARRARWIKALTLVGVLMSFAFAYGYARQYYLPKLKTYMKEEIVKLTQEQSPLVVIPGQIDFNFFPIGLVVSDIKFAPKEELKPYLSTLGLESVFVQLSLIELLQGRAHIHKIHLKGGRIGATLPASSKSNSKKSTESLAEIPFEKLSDLPLSKLHLEDFEVRLSQLGTDRRLEVPNWDLDLEILNGGLLLNTDMTNAIFQLEKEQTPRPYQLEAKLVLTPKAMQAKVFKLLSERSYVVASGRLGGDIRNLNITKGLFKARSRINLDSLTRIAREFLPSQQIPHLSGGVESQFDVSFEDINDPKVDFEVKTQDLVIQKRYRPQNATLKGQVDGDLLRLKTGLFEGAYGRFSLNNLQLGLKNNHNIQSNLNVEHVELSRFLQHLGLKATPLEVHTSLNIQCKGELKPQMIVRCADGKMVGKSIHIWSKSGKTIIKTKDMVAEGGVVFTEKEARFEAKLSLPHSKGATSGLVDYEKGFSIKYSADKLDFEDVEDLSGLGIEGQVKLAGTTTGNSSTAEFQMQAEGYKMWMSDYSLGDITTQIGYKSSYLTFRKMNGRLDSSRFAGLVSINLESNQIYLKMNSPFVAAEDMVQAFRRKVTMPITIKGSGPVSIVASGPLSFPHMSYDAKFQMFRGEIAGESYDELQLGFASDRGYVSFKDSYLTKGPGKLTFRGTANPEGRTQTRITAEDFRIEELNTIKRLGLNLVGDLHFFTELQGRILKPDVRINGRLSKIFVSDEAVADSVFDLEVNSKRLEARAQFLGDVAELELVYPIAEGEPFSFKTRTRNWNFIRSFAFVAESEGSRNYQANLESNIDLFSPTGKFWDTNGTIRISQIKLERSTYRLQNDRPLVVNFREGHITTSDFELNGGEYYLKLNSSDSTKSNLAGSLQGYLPLPLIHALTPLADLRGDLNLSARLTGDATNPEVIGSATIDDGLARIKGLRHSFENLKADLLFNESQIMVNQLSSRFGEGLLTGNGRMEFRGFKNFFIDLNGRLDKAKLEIPDGLKTEGSGRFTLTGSWFPYVLGGAYQVTSGEFVTDLTAAAGGGGKKVVRPSTFLPQVVSAKDNDPVHLDLEVQLLNPLRLSAALPDGKVTGRISGQLRALQNPTDPRLIGDLELTTGSQFTFRGNTFDVTSARISYQNAPPADPNLFISAQSVINARDQDESLGAQTDYEVKIGITGKPTKPQIELTSTPTLSQQEIVNLLVFGVPNTTTQTNSSLATNDVSSAAGGSSITAEQISVGSVLLNQTVGREIEDKLGVQVDLGQTQDPTAPVPRVSVSKQVTNKLNVTAGRTLEDSPRNQLDVNYRVNQNFSVTGRWEDVQNETTNQDVEEDSIGLDFLFRFQFR